MKPLLRVSVGMAWLVSGTVAHAQWQEPPTITVVETERSVRVLAANESFNLNVEGTTSEAGPYVDFVADELAGNWGSESKAEAKQNTQISSFSIHGTGEIKVDETVGGAPEAQCGSDATSRVQVTFTVPVNAPFSLTGIFEASANSPSLAEGSVSFTGFDENGSLFWMQKHFSATDPPEESWFFFTGTVKADTELNLLIFADGFCGGEEAGVVAVAASFDFDLDFGDRDGDGLLDSWEENGIDFPGDGIEIDLPGMGADPDRKDIFVEIDVMEGVPNDLLALILVDGAFAQAPAEMVNNPNGEPGINVHLIHDDGDAPAFASIFGTYEEIWDQFDAIKNEFFGSPSDRNHPNKVGIRRAREMIFRYCVWADTVVSDGNLIGGQAEAIRSNDFILAAGAVGDSHPTMKSKALAANFMHELGHTLGLQHGGQDGVNIKPNYLSIMNYLYVFPIDKITAQGTNAKDFWRLDYSRSSMRSLDETDLVEGDGLDGPQGRPIIFNSSSDSFPEPIVWTVAWADSAVVDWNNNGPPADPDPYQLDINRVSESMPVNFQTDLVSFSDWDRLWYHLSGTEEFNDGSDPTVGSMMLGIELDFFEAFYAVDWVDQTALGDLVFANDFELGSTTAWSDTVP